MHATVDTQFAVSIDLDKTLPLATLAESLTEMQLDLPRGYRQKPHRGRTKLVVH